MSDAQLSFRKSANIDRVTDKRKDSLFRLVDTDGSGTIDAQEFAVLYDAIKKDLAEELEKEAALAKEASSAKRRFKMLLLFVAVLVSFLAASVAANFAVIFTVVDQAITTTTTSTGLLEVKGSDTIAKTAAATEVVPLIVAPALDMETLGATKSLKIAYRESDYDDETIEAQLSIVAVRKHNTTFVEFVTDVPGEVVKVLNGKASLWRAPTDANGLEQSVSFNICAANATCSAFRASGIDVDAAYDLAKEELAKAGFEVEARRLTPAAGTCQAGSWDVMMHCGWTWNGPGSDPAWTFRGYCFGGALDINGGASGFPAWWDIGLGPAHPLTVGATAHYWWPPTGGSLMSLYWTGWGGMKHVVFFAHGKLGGIHSMWGQFCVEETYTCPDLTIMAFRHLVFAFGASGIWDATYNGNGWSDNVFTADYVNAATALSTGLIDTLKTESDGTDIPAFECDTVSHQVCSTSYYYGVSGLSGLPAAPTTRCTTSYSEVCPFNHRSEVMIIGFSDGGGLGVYMNYYYTMVTKAVAIDFWAYSAYDSWLADPVQTGEGDTFNAKIYTACLSNFFNGVQGTGPEGITPYASGTGTTFTEGAGLDDDYVGSADVTSLGKTFKFFTWQDDCTATRVSIGIHGLSGVPNDMDSDSGDWAAKCTASVSPLNVVGVHNEVQDYVDDAAEITDWLDANSFGTCTERRRELSGLSGSYTYTVLRAKQEYYITSKPFKDVKLGSTTDQGKKASMKRGVNVRSIKAKTFTSEYKAASKGKVSFKGAPKYRGRTFRSSGAIPE